MSKRIQQLLLGVISLIALSWASSCGPLYPDPPAPENVLLDREFMDYVGLPDNSYWIYRNVLTGELDSSYIGVTDTQMIDLDYGRQKVEYLHERRYGDLYLRGKKFNCRWYTVKGEVDVSGGVRKRDYFKFGLEDIGINIIASKDNKISWEFNSNDQVGRKVLKHTSYTVGNEMYSDVVHVITSDDWEAKMVINQTFYARGVGPIYRIFSDSSEWELLRYKIGEYVIPVGE